MIGYKMKGDFSKSMKYLERVKVAARLNNLDRYGREGVAALSSATPIDTGLTASSWYYKIERTETSIKLLFCNSNIQNGVPIAIILDKGHGTNNGGWVEGRDYIHPAIQPVFDKLAKDAWREVTKL
jgi:hypothetical protein